VFPNNQTAAAQPPTVKSTGSTCNNATVIDCWYEARDAEAANPPPPGIQWSIRYRGESGWPDWADVRVEATKHNVRVLVQINFECYYAGTAGCTQYYASGLKDTASVASFWCEMSKAGVRASRSLPGEP
jgi:hypothetical protein